MTEQITNLTNPGQDPADGDQILRTSENYTITEEYFEPRASTTEEIAGMARDWRDGELLATDYIVPLSDHPQHAAYITYRAALRAWPSTSDFPATRPTVGE